MLQIQLFYYIYLLKYKILYIKFVKHLRGGQYEN